MDVWLWRLVGGVLLALSLLGWLNLFFFRIHGPALDLGVVAGLLGWAALYAANRMKDG
jgi:hypothetical protein